MTGSSAVETRREPSSGLHVTENRDPSPSTYASSSTKVADPSEEGEPWDEPSSAPAGNQGSSSIMSILGSGTCSPFFDPNEELNDGELPSLSRKPRKKERTSSLLSTGQKSTRPLSPPSRAGLSVESEHARQHDESPDTKRRKARSQFWSQLDPPSPEVVEAEEEGPDDEVAARRRTASRPNDVDETPQRKDEHQVDEREVEMEEEQYLEDANCFEYTLASLGNMCGTGETKSPPREVIRLPRNKDVDEDGAEHTAIEVEYVEKAGEKKEDSSVTWSPSKKSALLAAMARRAKDDFNENESKATKRRTPKSKMPSKPESPQRSRQEEELEENDIYNSFSAAEKRKFLKLINTGVAPPEAARKIVEGRDKKKKSEKKEKATGKKEKATEKKDEKAESDTPSGKSRFSFWKKGSKRGSSDSQDDSVVAVSPDTDTPTSSRRKTRSRSLETPTSRKRGNAAAGAAAAVAPEQNLSPTADKLPAVTKTPDEGKPPAAPAVGTTIAPSRHKQPAPKRTALRKPNYSTTATTVGAVATTGIAATAVASEHDADYGRSARAQTGRTIETKPSTTMSGTPSSNRREPSTTTSGTSTSNRQKQASAATLGTPASSRLEPLTKASGTITPSRREQSVLMNPEKPSFTSEESPDGSPESLALKADPMTEKQGAAKILSTAAADPVSVTEKQGAAKVAGTIAAAAAGAAAAAALPTSTISTQSEDDVDSILGQFKKSGINYYDAVRKEVRDEEGDEDDRAMPATPRFTKPGPRSSRIATLRAAPRTQGFTALDEKGSQDKSVVPRGRQKNWDKEIVGAEDRPATVSPEARRIMGFLLLGNGHAGFAELRDDDSSSSELQPSGTDPLVVDVTPEAWREPAADPESLQTLPSVEESSKEDRPQPKELMVEVNEQGNYDDENAAAAVEKELLRPMAKPIEADESEPAVLSEEGDTVFDLNTLRSVPDTVNSKGNVLDISADTYMGSVTSTSYGRMSVASGKSGWTGVTEPSSVHTHSSRKRRPGAAKDRLARVKEAEARALSPKRGWHETIRDAASKNNKVWDPAKGWVDFQDSIGVAEIAPRSVEKLNVSLDNVSLGLHRDREEKSRSKSEPRHRVTVPFPKEWELERDSMLRSGVELKRSRSLSPSQSARVEPSVSAAQEKPQSSEASRRARQSKTIYQQNTDQVPSVLARTLYEFPRELEETIVSEEVNEPAETRSKEADKSAARDAKFDEIVAATALLGLVAEEASTSSHKSEGEKEESVEVPEADGAVLDDDSSALNRWITRSAKPSLNLSDQSMEASDQAVASSGEVEKYMQLGDNGSVRSVAPDSARESELSPRFTFDANTVVSIPEDDDANEKENGNNDDQADGDERAPLLQSREFSDSEDRAPDVEVVKEKCDEDDFSLFAGDDQAALDQSSSSLRRRGRGPVDLDEVENLNSDDEEEDEQTWEPDSFMQGDVSTTMFDKPRDKPQNKARTSPSIIPPKLEKNRRDVSPIRARSAGSEATFSQEAGPTPSDTVDVKKTGSVPSKPQAEEESHTVRTGKSSNSSVKMRAMQWESMSARSSKTGTSQSDLIGLAYSTDETTTRSGDKSTSTSQQPYSVSGDTQLQRPDESHARRVNPAGTAEWKSFLGKKVSAESAAAVGEGKARHRKEPDGAKPRESSNLGDSRRVVLVKHEDDDSLFEFASDTGKKSEASNGSNRRKKRPQESGPDDDDFSNISPIQKRAEDESIDTDLEKVSDTGTAMQQGSFMKRLQACAAPILSRQLGHGADRGDGVPMAHLAFLRTNPPVTSGNGAAARESSRFVPPALCGRPDTIDEDEDDEVDDSRKAFPTAENRKHLAAHLMGTSKSFKSSSTMNTQSKAKSGSRRIENGTKDSSSVSSDDLGARTSYLEAIAMKTAVSNPKSRKKSSSSDVSTGSKRSHSERWVALLEKRSADNSSPLDSKAHSSTELSRAAAKYAAEKVEEMMEVMKERPNSTPRSWRSKKDVGIYGKESVDEMLDNISSTSSSSSKQLQETKSIRSEGSKSKGKIRKKSNSAKAAEELAAARVEAMMAAMTSSKLDGGEI